MATPNVVVKGEVWKAIPEFQGKYEVSTLGQVRSNARQSYQRVMSLSKMAKGYKMVGLSTGKRWQYKYFSVHRLVAQCFIPNPMAHPVVNHINGNKLDNTVENLEWVTHSENVAHAFSHGLRKSKKGILRVVTYETVTAVHQLRHDGLTLKETAARVGISYGTIQKILYKPHLYNFPPKTAEV